MKHRQKESFTPDSCKQTVLNRTDVISLQIGVEMETTSRKQALLKAIYERLEQVYEDTLEDVLELLNISEREDSEDIADAVVELEDAKVKGTISWEEYQKELK